MHRRSILAMMTGGAASAVSGVSPQEVANMQRMEQDQEFAKQMMSKLGIDALF